MDDFDASVFIVTEGGESIYPSEYDKGDDGDGRFVMLVNDMLNPDYQDDNTIFISNTWRYEDGVRPDGDVMSVCRISNDSLSAYKDDCEFADAHNRDYPDPDSNRYRHDEPNMFTTIHFDGLVLIKPLLMWQSEFFKVDDNHKDDFSMDMCGFANTFHIIKRAEKRAAEYAEDDRNGCLDYGSGVYFNVMDIGCYIPAVMAAYRAVVGYGGGSVHGYLPAIGQLRIISQNIMMVNGALSVGGRDNDRLPWMKQFSAGYALSQDWWSSTEYTNELAFSWRMNNVELRVKENAAFVLPLYKIKI